MKIKILFTHKGTNKLYSIAEYIYHNSKSKTITTRYIKKLQKFISSTLKKFPKAGRPSDEIYKNTRKLVFQSYSIIYMYDEENSTIHVVTLYRENLP